MEEFDDLVQAPDDQGALDLSHQAWVTLDEAVFAWEESLIVLNAGYNRITGLPPSIGKLVCVRELDLCNNRLELLPAEIGCCVRLRKLRLNGNLLRELPEEIGKCQLLEELTLSENQLTALPPTMGELRVLRVLHLQNNRLESLCPELGACLSLEDIDCAGNKSLANVPGQVLSDTAIILWMCRHNMKHKDHVGEWRGTVQSLEQAAELSQQEQAQMRAEIEELRAENARLLAERPERFLRLLAVTRQGAAHASALKSKACVTM